MHLRWSLDGWEMIGYQPACHEAAMGEAATLSLNLKVFAACAETRVALIQRSCGYTLRPTLSIDTIQRAVQAIKEYSPGCVVIVDNCYGEFTEEQEPCHVRL